MDRHNKGILVLFGAVAVVFLFGMVRLLLLRFEAGDVYPAYSSYRADPLGVRALYGALESLPGISVRRNLAPLTGLGEGRDTTLFICGANLSKDPEDLLEALETFVADGARLVVTFFPVLREPDSSCKDKEPDEDEEESDAEGEDKEKAPWDPEMVSIADRWGFSFAYAGLPGEAWARKRIEGDALPDAISWHTALYFDDCDDAWQPLYAWDGHTVIMQRPWPRGTMVLCSDSYFVSNEAMREEQLPELLAWLVGPSSTVVFDETHLGAHERPGVMALVRRYRLAGLLAAMALVAGLFVWRNMAGLAPKREAHLVMDATSAVGPDATSGLVNLLRRSIRTADIISVCVEEWRRALPNAASAAKAARIQAAADREKALPVTQRNRVAAYKTICAILTEKEDKIRNRG